MNICNKCYFNIETKLAVFVTYISCVSNYGSEIWGLLKAPDIEKLHLDLFVNPHQMF